MILKDLFGMNNLVMLREKIKLTCISLPMGMIIPNHSYLSQLDVTYKTPDLMSHFLPPHEVSFTF
ncbi:hypothetical protein, partial [Streptococcus pneumoniae]|uniref:hypothetical protein n=1 Tax=Streptococcus pneumoniae TaxID=1313 RepID=UPI00067B0E4D